MSVGGGVEGTVYASLQLVLVAGSRDKQAHVETVTPKCLYIFE